MRQNKELGTYCTVHPLPSPWGTPPKLPNLAPIGRDTQTHARSDLFESPALPATPGRAARTARARVTAPRRHARRRDARMRVCSLYWSGRRDRFVYIRRCAQRAGISSHCFSEREGRGSSRGTAFGAGRQGAPAGRARRYYTAHGRRGGGGEITSTRHTPPCLVRDAAQPVPPLRRAGLRATTPASGGQTDTAGNNPRAPADRRAAGRKRNKSSALHFASPSLFRE